MSTRYLFLAAVPFAFAACPGNLNVGDATSGGSGSTAATAGASTSASGSGSTSSSSAGGSASSGSASSGSTSAGASSGGSTGTGNSGGSSGAASSGGGSGGSTCPAECGGACCGSGYLCYGAGGSYGCVQDRICDTDRSCNCVLDAGYVYCSPFTTVASCDDTPSGPVFACTPDTNICASDAGCSEDGMLCSTCAPGEYCPTPVHGHDTSCTPGGGGTGGAGGSCAGCTAGQICQYSCFGGTYQCVDAPAPCASGQCGICGLNCQCLDMAQDAGLGPCPSAGLLSCGADGGLVTFECVEGC
jgi:hypothetical protein